MFKATQAGKRFTPKDFGMTLATHLMSGQFANDNIPVGKRRVSANLEPRLHNVGPHIPVIGLLTVCAVCSACFSHPAKSIIRCETRDVHVPEQ